MRSCRTSLEFFLFLFLLLFVLRSSSSLVGDLAEILLAGDLFFVRVNLASSVTKHQQQNDDKNSNNSINNQPTDRPTDRRPTDRWRTGEQEKSASQVLFRNSRPPSMAEAGNKLMLAAFVGLLVLFSSCRCCSCWLHWLLLICCFEFVG